MTIILHTTDKQQITIKDTIEFNLTQSIDAACDSLWATFMINSDMGEINEVVAVEDGRLIFSGLCDCQKMTQDKNGYKVCFYARSYAGVLVDNEAPPTLYEKPSALQLVFSLAMCYGFKSSLPDIYSESPYEIQKGTSRFGAINKFVRLLTGNKIYVTPQKEIICLTESDDIKDLNGYDIISSQFVINRSEPCSRINFKRQSSDADYCLHTKSKTCEELGIERQRYVTLSAVPQWQREHLIIDTIKSSFERYKLLEVVVDGYVNEPLLQRFNYKDMYNDFGELALSEKQYINDKYGKRTRLTLKKQLDIKEITYVD